MRLTELVQRPKNTFSTLSFTTTGIVGIFNHLTNCPALLLYNLIIILIALQPVEKQIKLHGRMITLSRNTLALARLRAAQLIIRRNYTW